jgi:hypothetical protein
MIGTRIGASAALAVLGLGLLVGSRTVDPSTTIAAERLVGERAGAAVRALDELREAVRPALDAAREAAAAVLSADEPVSPRLEAAAALAAASEATVLPARRAVALVGAARVAWHPDVAPDPEPIEVGELASIAAQLRAAGPACDAFVELRMRASGLPSVLEQALSALDRGALEDAADLTARARADHDAIVAWETDLPTIPVWIDTTGAMISAVEQVLDATRVGDEAAAIEAAEAFAALGSDAAEADRALRIALSEGGAALTAAPLERLAAAMEAIETSRDAAAATRAVPDR